VPVEDRPRVHDVGRSRAFVEALEQRAQLGARLVAAILLEAHSRQADECAKLPGATIGLPRHLERVLIAPLGRLEGVWVPGEEKIALYTVKVALVEALTA